MPSFIRTPAPLPASSQPARRILVTGGPGAGKTTLLRALAQRGYATAPDTARALIRRRKRAGLPARPGPVEFARLTLDADIEQYTAALAGKSGVVFFERGIPDSLGMLAEAGQLTDSDREQFLAAYPYEPTAFILPPWEEIYRTDAERDQTFAEARQVDARIRSWYAQCSYTLVEVPVGPVAARCSFVLERLGE